MMRFLRFKKMLPEWLLFMILSILVFGAGRLFLLFRYTDVPTRIEYNDDVWTLLVRGLLFDIKVASIVISILLLAALFGLVHNKANEWLYRNNRTCLLIVLMVFIGSVVANIFYYGVYDRPFDVFVFGLIEEDTWAVLQTIWVDYPIIRAVLAVGLCGWVFNFLFRYLHQAMAARLVCSSGFVSKVILVLTLVVLLVLGVRGSIGTFPLGQRTAQVSQLSVLNKLLPNSVVALEWAYAEYRASKRFHPVSSDDGLRLFEQVLGREVSSASLDQLNIKLPENAWLNQHKPNVVFALMESMSSHMLQLDLPKRDLLGGLRSHFAQDWVFHRFISEGNGTSDSLHRLFIRSPYDTISQSIAKNKEFATNMFLPYIKAGYRIVFVTSGNGAWRDLSNFTRHLGVHEFVDESVLRQRYPGARFDTWGVPDEYMFRYAKERLQRSMQEYQPVFIFMLSTTNHPPYRLPDEAVRQNFAFTSEEQQRFEQLGDVQQINEVFNTYRYANDQLGRFISDAKQIGKTIIAASGDHNLRAINYPDLRDVALRHGVPFYVYAPREYHLDTLYIPERVGSHKDIMPTLYALSLSGQEYLQTGCNLLALRQDDNPWCGYGFNHDEIILSEGVLTLNNRQFYAWDNPAQLKTVSRSSTLPKQSEETAARAMGSNDFLYWVINHMATK